VAWTLLEANSCMISLPLALGTSKMIQPSAVSPLFRFEKALSSGVNPVVQHVGS
jgi:hypothetical protein